LLTAYDVVTAVLLSLSPSRDVICSVLQEQKGHNQGQAVPQEKLTSYLVLMIS
jgi:hypothetical protein